MGGLGGWSLFYLSDHDPFRMSDLGVAVMLMTWFVLLIWEGARQKASGVKKHFSKNMIGYVLCVGLRALARTLFQAKIYIIFNDLLLIPTFMFFVLWISEIVKIPPQKKNVGSG